MLICVITREFFDAADFLDIANREFEIERAWELFGTSDNPQIEREVDLAWRIRELDELASAIHSRHSSHKARSMTRKGSKRHTVRVDRGTTAFYKAIKAENAARQSWEKGSNRSQRRYARLEAECRNPRTVNRAYRELIG